MSVESLGGSRYSLLLIDDFSRSSWTFSLKTKGEAAKMIRDWITAVEVTFSTKVRGFQSDRGCEFTGSALQDFFREKGISHRLTAPYSPQQNGLCWNEFTTDE
ncbi:DDE-type integrase transposase recombinase [Podarcis lilfordi]|uniref:DDE-type integrase transposase recombinase n=1 Tax=Podarcis lilfordi TaxID=74358 RepID=A0AA35NUD1_9SAUR|nr:DDE-type integrase transposase recombinase [Podarcis lilfordi]